MKAVFAEYDASTNKWKYISEAHASIMAARIRAKVRGWSLIKFGERKRTEHRL